MKNTLILFFACLFLLNSCNNESEVLPEKTDLSVLQENSEANLLATKSDIPYEWKTFPELGDLPAAMVSSAYSPDREYYFNIRITNPLYNIDKYSGQQGSSIGQIQVQWRRPRYGLTWYNYHPRIRNCEELYTDTIYDATALATGDKMFYQFRPQWIHSLNTRALPQDDLEFRVRLLYPLVHDPELDKSRATLWSTNYNSEPNFFGYNFYDNGGDKGKESYIVNLSFNINASIHNPEGRKIDRVNISAFGKSSLFYSGSSVNLQVSTTQKLVLKVPTPYSYTVTVTVYYTSGDPDVTTQEISHSLYLHEYLGSGNTMNFNDYVDVYLWKGYY